MIHKRERSVISYSGSLIYVGKAKKFYEQNSHSLYPCFCVNFFLIFIFAFTFNSSLDTFKGEGGMLLVLHAYLMSGNVVVTDVLALMLYAYWHSSIICK